MTSIESFKECMRQLTTGVTVITTISEDNEKSGVTINTFSSLSLDPLLILFSLKKTSFCYNTFINSKHFTVNILSSDQQKISDLFTKAGKEKWKEIKTIKDTLTDCPAIEGSLAFLECAPQNFYEGGDHTIIVGKVINAVKLADNKKPLVYFSSNYTNIQ